MANKNRKKQNNVSAEHTITNDKKDQTTGKSSGNGFDVAALWELVKKYQRYIAAGALFAIMLLVLVKCTGPVSDTPKEPVTDEQTTDQAVQTEEFQVDAIPEVNELIRSYYTLYAAGDVVALEKIAQPMSDTEKSYIQVFSKYVDSYDNLSCHTKSGLNSGEYVVSVRLEMKFKDVATAAPGLDFFYLRTNEKGELYIDNAYSQFNQSNMEESTQADVQALINEFEQAEDVAALQAEVQQRYDQAVAADQDLNQMANETIPDAISAWVQSLTQAEDEAQGSKDQTDEQDKPADGDTAKDDQTDTDKSETDQADTDKTEKDDKDQSDNKSDNSDGKAKTAYAKEGINLRKGPSTDKSIVTQIPLGDKLKIYPDTKKNGWVKAVYNGKKGYVKLEFVTTDKSKVVIETDTAEEEEPAKALPEGKSITLTDSVNVRVSMSETADKVGLAYKGDTVKVIQSYAEGWTKVEWNGQTGYIKTELIK